MAQLRKGETSFGLPVSPDYAWPLQNPIWFPFPANLCPLKLFNLPEIRRNLPNVQNSPFPPDGFSGGDKGIELGMVNQTTKSIGRSF